VASYLATINPVVLFLLSLNVPLEEQLAAAAFAFDIDGPKSFETNPATKAKDKKNLENFFINHRAEI
jgi:hypothetical protein